MRTKEDQRVRISKRILKESLLSLMKKKDLASISIRELCQEANINRSTFYAHYDTIGDVLSEIETEEVEGMKNSILNSKDPFPNTLANRVELACLYMKDHEEVMKVLFENNLSESHFANLLFGHELILNTLSRKYKKKYGEDGVKLIHYFLINGAYSTIRSWLLHGSKKTPKEMGKIIEELLCATISEKV